jgi:hypothetical protein
MIRHAGASEQNKGQCGESEMVTPGAQPQSCTFCWNTVPWQSQRGCGDDCTIRWGGDNDFRNLKSGDSTIFVDNGYRVAMALLLNRGVRAQDIC